MKHMQIQQGAITKELLSEEAVTTWTGKDNAELMTAVKGDEQSIPKDDDKILAG